MASPFVCRWLSSPSQKANAVAYSRKGDLAVGRQNGILEILEGKSHGLLMRLYGPLPTTHIRNIHFLEDAPFLGKYVVTTGLHGEIDVWSLETARVVVSSPSHGGPIYASCLRPGSRLAVACDDGGVRLFKIGKESSVLTFDDDDGACLSPCDTPSIILEKTVAREPDSRILSVCWRGDSDLFVGTSNSLVLKYDAKTSSACQRIALPRRKAPSPNKKRKIEGDAPEGVNVFKFLADKQAAEEKARSNIEGVLETEVISLIYLPKDDLIAAGDSRGAVSLIDPVTCTVVKEFIQHEAPIQNLALLESSGTAHSLSSVGVDGRLVLYSKTAGEDLTVGCNDSWGVGIVRYAHLGDATALCQTSEDNRSVVVSGADGSLALYKDGLASIEQVGEMPRRIHHVSLIGDRPSPKICQSHKLVMERTEGAVVLWSMAPESSERADFESIMDEARASLSLSETQSLSEVSLADLRQKQGWNPVKFGQVRFEQKSLGERLIDSCFIDDVETAGQDTIKFLTLTHNKLRAFSVDMKEAVIKSLPLGPHLQKIVNVKDRSILGIFSLGAKGLLQITYADCVKSKPTNFGFSILDSSKESVLVNINNLAASVEQTLLSPCVGESRSRFLVTLLSNAARFIFKTADEKKTSRSWKGLQFHAELPLPPPSTGSRSLLDGLITFDHQAKHLAAFIFPSRVCVFDLEKKEYLKLSSNENSGETTPVLKLKVRGLWEEKVPSARALLFSKSKSDIVELVVVTRRNSFVITLTKSKREGMVAKPSRAERLAALTAEDVTLFANWIPTDIEASADWVELANSGSANLLVFALSRQQLEDDHVRPFARRVYSGQ